MNNLNENAEIGPGSAALDEISQLTSAKLPRLLLIEDDPGLLYGLCELLGTGDYHLETAATGMEACEKLNQMPVDLVLLDLNLPDLSGHAIMDFINARELDTSVIVMSGNNGIDAAIGALRRGAYGYLRKPYSGDELLNTVQNVLQKRSLQAENRAITRRLERSEKLYRYLIDSSPDLIFTTNTDGRFTFINERCRQLFGCRPEQLINAHYADFFHNDDLELAHLVFTERSAEIVSSRNIELRLKPFKVPTDGADTLGHAMTVSCSSMGMYSEETDSKPGQFLGTYGVARDITDAKRAQQLISHQACHDSLTGLPNRALFRDRLNLALIQAPRNNTELAVLFVDLDRFKNVNDTMGHMKGDELLKLVAARLREGLREGDTLARLGGDEFILLLPGLQGKSDVVRIAEQIVQSLGRPFVLGNGQAHVSGSAGIAVFPGDGVSADELISHADVAMYNVKTHGKNGYCFYESGMHDASRHTIALAQNLHQALGNGELEMYYQPQINLETGQVMGAEALIRWNHPELGVLNAGRFMPIAEESGLMLQISDWMLDPLCRDLREWNAVSADPLRLSLNLSPHYLDRGDFAFKLNDAMQRHGIDASQLEVEVTENLCMRNPQYVTEQLTRLCQLGVSIAIDDFGTGYSSLSHLHQFPVHTIKIDQSFIREIHTLNGHYPVLTAIISIARGLGLNLIAEGVETSTQARFLAQAGCSMVQGFMYFKAMPQREFLKVIRKQRRQFYGRNA